MTTSFNIAIQCDPPASFEPGADSTLELGLAAQARGHRLHYYLPHELTCRNGRIEAPLRPVVFIDNTDCWHREDAAVVTDLSAMDVVLIRQDPPFDMAYITATYLLERLDGPLVLNDPRALRDHPEKLIPLHFPKRIPPTVISRDEAVLQAFFAEHGDVVIKPLYGYGGRGVLRCTRGSGNFAALIELLLSQGNGEPVIVQAYLPDVRSREMRVVLVDGEVAAAYIRRPAEDELRSNVRVGGTPVPTELTVAERAIAQEVAAWCRERGFLFVGLDLIGEHLIEVNVTSPTGLRTAAALYGIDPAGRFWDAVEARLRA